MGGFSQWICSWWRAFYNNQGKTRQITVYTHPICTGLIAVVKETFFMPAHYVLTMFNYILQKCTFILFYTG